MRSYFFLIFFVFINFFSVDKVKGLDLSNYEVLTKEFSYTQLYEDGISVYLSKKTFVLSLDKDYISLDDLSFIERKAESKKFDISSLLQIRVVEREDGATKRRDNDTYIREDDLQKKVSSSEHSGGVCSVTEKHKVYFRLNSYNLTRDQIESLDDFMNNLALKYKNYLEADYKLVGWSCSLGDVRYNVNLSRMRAKKVADYLERRYGIRKILFEGRGISKQSDVLCLNRFVEIQVSGLELKE